MTKIDGAAGFKDGCVKQRKRFSPELPAEVVQRLDGVFSRERLEEALEVSRRMRSPGRVG